MFVLAWIRKLYKVLSADASPSAIAFAAAFGIMAGLLPFTAGLTLLLIALVLVVRVQVSAAIAFWAIASLFRLAALPLFVEVGESLLEAESLKGFWTSLLNLPIVAWLDLHVYAVLGGAVVGFAVGAICFYPVRTLVIAYRKWAHDRLSQNKFFRWLTNFWLTKAFRFVLLGVRT